LTIEQQTKFDLVVNRRSANARGLANPQSILQSADGIRYDEDGNVWAGMGWVGDGYDGIHVLAPDGTRIGQIRMPEIVSNIAFGGSKRNRLFMTGSTSLYAIYVETRGASIGG
jgi:gluconolactonase